MKVKAFEHVIRTEERWGRLADIEVELNRWLAAHPDIEIVEVKLSTAAATNNERAAPATFTALCLVFYREN
jgi:DNA-binding SARP family transcriptional activator